MNDNNLQLPISNILQNIDQSHNILIILPQQLTIDTAAAGLSLFLSLKQYLSKSENRNVAIVCGMPMTVAFQRLYGVDQISSQMGSKNLVISLKTNPDNIEKVSYDSDDQSFNLVIETKPGIPRIDKGLVDFNYRGINADLIIAVGLENPDQAGTLYSQDKSIFENKNVIVVSSGMRSTKFGNIANIIDLQTSSTSELVAKMLQFLKMPVDGDICTNLIAGIESATNNFVYKSLADTFAMVSWCMRQGGRRNHLTSPINQQLGFDPNSFIKANENKVISNPFLSVDNVANITSGQENLENKQAQVPQAPFVNDIKANPDPAQQVPQDWFNPKIYRGNQS